MALPPLMGLILFASSMAVVAFGIAMLARRRWIPWLIPVAPPAIGVLLDTQFPAHSDARHAFLAFALYASAFLLIGIASGALVRLVAYRGSEAGWNVPAAALAVAATTALAAVGGYLATTVDRYPHPRAAPILVGVLGMTLLAFVLVWAWGRRRAWRADGR